MPARWLALLNDAEKLTLRPREMTAADLEPLRVEGLSDRDIVDLNQVVAYFNYVNRVADGLGVDLEPEYVCHQSGGLIARALERAGIPTVAVGQSRGMMARVKFPSAPCWRRPWAC